MKLVECICIFGFAVNAASAQHAAISPEEMSVLYVGLKNPLRVAISGVPYSKTVLKSDVGTVVKTDSVFEIHVPVRNANQAIVTVGKLRRKDTIWCYSKNFRIRNVPKPEIRIGSLDISKPILKSSFVIQRKIFLVIQGFVYEGIKLNITSYKAMVFSKNFGYRKVEVMGSSLAPLTAALEGLLAGDKVYFYDVQYMDVTGNLIQDEAWAQIQDDSIMGIRFLYKGKLIFPKYDEFKKMVHDSGNFKMVLDKTPKDTIDIENHHVIGASAHPIYGKFRYHAADSSIIIENADTTIMGKVLLTEEFHLINGYDRYFAMRNIKEREIANIHQFCYTFGFIPYGNWDIQIKTSSGKYVNKVILDVGRGFDDK
ncbi:MAG: hypothetical protein KG003_12155 [Bacteroidetes bacterium]|nr:hypothetical protein [Bacteroidota bacterium]